MAIATRFWRWILAGPYRVLLQLALLYVAFNLVVRLGLSIHNGEAAIFWSGRIVGALLIGAVFDLGVAVFMLLPLSLLLGVLRSSSSPRLDYLGQRLIAWSMLPFAGVLVFVAAAEFVFWNEFASRFNFIAVDYLVYTNEVIGNIRESYPMPLLLGTVATLSLALWAVMLIVTRSALVAAPPQWRGRLARSVVWLLLPLISYGALEERYKEFSDDSQANELAGNGAFDFFHAYQTNEIDYERFYKTVPEAQALASVRTALHLQGKASADYDIGRQVLPSGPERRWNVVLVSIESLSASYLEHFGNPGKLTPNLDRMANQGLLFTQLYATGTRTVRGLEALTLSVPPTPGHSIVKRPNNDGLYSLGSVFAQKGYTPLYVYGGYSYFDNMQAFFQGNGYRVADRTDLASDEIHFQNIWGVCDEDLFTLALREIDKEAVGGKPFFAHVMTVSNHRPFTYPEGRIDIPSKTGRDGGAKYTDWAIGDFIQRARQKPWFEQTVFVFVADHTHRGRGKMDLATRNYLIPMIIWAPGKIAQGRVDQLASQIDVAPTMLGLMNMRYQSRFFGSDILAPDAPRRALLANYQTVGWYQDGLIVELKPGGRTRVVDAVTGLERTPDAVSAALTAQAISYYQLASESFGSGAMKLEQTHAYASAAAPVATAGASRAP